MSCNRRSTRSRNARLNIDNLTSEVNNLKIALDGSRKKEIQVTLALDDSRKELDQAEKLALVRKKEYDALKETHALAEALVVKLRGESKELEAKSQLTGDALAEKLKANAELLIKLAAAEGKLSTLEKDLAGRQAAMTAAEKNLANNKSQLSEVERLMNVLGKEKLELLAKLKTSDLRVRILESEIGRFQTESTDAQKKIADLLRGQDSLNQKMLISAKDAETYLKTLASLKGENIELLKRNKAIQAEVENRFAGITLTGRKIVFMVDMSGSMDLIDVNTADPDKWPLVCETIGRLLQSLADMRQFQVILFSDRVRYPLGNDGKWFDYRSADDARVVVEHLKKIKPRGETNMHAAFEETFRFRDQGLDTVYVISDGLPNAGPVGVGANLTESQITEIHAKQIRTKLKSDWNRPVTGQNRVKINTIGFFFESPDVGAFLWALARENDGSFVGMSRP